MDTQAPPAPVGGTEKAPRYPPLVVEKITNWTAHFKALAEKLGRPPNGRPYGQGIRFMPADETEYRAIQSYLTELERTENISWFSYSLPAERSLKVAIRGLPSDTDVELIAADLREQGFEPEYLKNIQARQGKPGSIFYAQFKKTANLIPAIYDVTEILFMPGITIEAWRGKRGPAQCHRCQQFRHSSHNCHRVQACVRCGEQHAARECPRPREEPATCANCKGTHPANYKSCPIFKKEIRNKKAGTVAATQTTGRRGTAPVVPTTVEETAQTSLMAPANAPRSAGQNAVQTASQKKKKKKKAKTPQNSSEQQPKPKPKQQDAPRRDSLGQTIGVLKEILEAVQGGTDPETATLQGLMRILQTGNGSQRN